MTDTIAEAVEAEKAAIIDMLKGMQTGIDIVLREAKIGKPQLADAIEAEEHLK